MRQPIVKDLRSETKAKAKACKAKDFIKCPRGASRPRPWPRGLHHCVELVVVRSTVVLDSETKPSKLSSKTPSASENDNGTSTLLARCETVAAVVVVVVVVDDDADGNEEMTVDEWNVAEQTDIVDSVDYKQHETVLRSDVD